MASNDVGYYTLPVILSFDGIDKQVNSKLGAAFKGISKSSSKAFADATEIDLKRATEAYGKMRDRAQDALGKVRVEEDKLAKARASGKQDQVVAAEERLNKARRDSTRINKEAIASYGEIENAQKRLTQSSGGLFDKLKGMGGAAASGGKEAASGFVDGFGGPIAALGTKAGPIGIALAATAGIALLAGKVLADNVLAGMDQLQGQANVAAKLGLTPEQVKPLAKAAAEAYAGNFGSSIEGNMDAARAAIQGGLLGPNASQGDIQKVVEQLATVAAVTGEDIPSSVRTAQQAIRTGLVGSYTEAFDLIVKSQQSGLNASGDLLDTINEYGTQFRKLGITGPEAMGLISQAVQGGARDTDVAADAIKKFSIRSIDGSKTTGDAFHDLGMSWKASTEALAAGGDSARQTFQQVIDRIAAIEDPAKRAQIQVALFGTQAEDLGGALNNMNLDTAAAQFGQVAGATQQAADTLGGTAASSIESAKRSIQVSVDGIQQSLAEVFGPALQKIADWVVAHKDEIGDFFVSAAHIAIDAGAMLYQACGGIAAAMGSVVEAAGDFLGAVAKADAWISRMQGDTEAADAMDKQAEAYFSMGEGLLNFADTAGKFDPSNLHKALDDAAAKAKSATTETSVFTTTVDALDGKDVKVPIAVDTKEASDELDSFFKKYNEMSINPDMSMATGALGGALLGANIPVPGSSAVRGDVAGINLSTIQVAAQQYANNCIDAAAQVILSASDVGLTQDQIEKVIPRGGSIGSLAAGLNQLNPQGRYVPIEGSGGSPEALFKAIKESIDKGIGSVLNVAPGASVAGKQFEAGHFIAITGYDAATGQINLSDTADGSVYSVSAGDAFQASRGRGIVAGTGTAGAGGLGNTAGAPFVMPGAAAAAAATPTAPIPVAVTPSPSAPIPTPTATMQSSPIDTSRLYDTGGIYGPGGSPDLMNAFGPGYKPGIGTPGYNEYGDPGYYKADARSVREAQQRAQDAQDRIAEADKAAQAARDARTALNDAPSTVATASAIAGADQAVTKAEKAAAKARQDAADAATDAADTAKGTFTKAQEAEKQKASKSDRSGKRGSKDLGLGGLGSIGASFLKDTFGIGDWLPGLDNLIPLQMADTLMGAFMGPLEGYMNGGLNFQNPDWQPGMTQEDLAAANQASGFVPGSGGTSSSPFGIPNIAAPPMPDGAAHSGAGGAPGPATVVNVDQSQNFNNSPLGWNPTDVNKQRDNNINRAPRLPVGMG